MDKTHLKINSIGRNKRAFRAVKMSRIAQTLSSSKNDPIKTDLEIENVIFDT